MSARISNSKNAIGLLRGLSRKRPRPEKCELCGASVAPQHSHLLERSTERILCACEACSILFNHRGEAARFLQIPRDAKHLGNFRLTDDQWNALMLPIDLAFFLRSSKENRVIAYYPSPAGSAESLLNLDSWTDIATDNPQLENMSPDVEALLVNRTRGRREYYIAPIDECHRLTGIIRLHWRGFSGGEEVWREIDTFLERLSAKSVESPEAVHA